MASARRSPHSYPSGRWTEGHCIQATQAPPPRQARDISNPALRPLGLSHALNPKSHEAHDASAPATEMLRCSIERRSRKKPSENSRGLQGRREIARRNGVHTYRAVTLGIDTTQRRSAIVVACARFEETHRAVVIARADRQNRRAIWASRRHREVDVTPADSLTRHRGVHTKTNPATHRRGRLCVARLSVRQQRRVHPRGCANSQARVAGR